MMVLEIVQACISVFSVVATYIFSSRFGVREAKKYFGEQDIIAKKELTVLLLTSERDAIQHLASSMGALVIKTIELFPAAERVPDNSVEQRGAYASRYEEARKALLEAQTVPWESQPFLEKSLHDTAEELFAACNLQVEAFRILRAGTGALPEERVEQAYQETNRIMERYRAWTATVRDSWRQRNLFCEDTIK